MSLQRTKSPTSPLVPAVLWSRMAAAAGISVQFGAQNGIKTVLADVAAENAGSCGVMRALGFTPTENGTFRRSGSQTEYKNLTFKKEL